MTHLIHTHEMSLPKILFKKYSYFMDTIGIFMYKLRIKRYYDMDEYNTHESEEKLFLTEKNINRYFEY